MDPHPTRTGPAGPALELVSWDDLARLPASLDELAAHAAAIVRHARRWVCQSDGLEPSPVCVLRPLVPVVHAISDALDDLGRDLAADLADLREGVVLTSTATRAADELAQDVARSGLAALGEVA